MKATTKIELPLGISVPERGTPFTFDQEHAKTMIEVSIVRATRGEMGRSVVVELELDVELDAVFDMHGKPRKDDPKYQDSASRGVRVAFRVPARCPGDE